MTPLVGSAPVELQPRPLRLRRRGAAAGKDSYCGAPRGFQFPRHIPGTALFLLLLLPPENGRFPLILEGFVLQTLGLASFWGERNRVHKYLL